MGSGSAETIEVPELCRYLDDFADIEKEIVNRYEGFIFDMDGVLWEGTEVIAGAREALVRLRAMGKRVFFCTNNSIFNKKQYVEMFQRRGFDDIAEESIYCAASATANYLQKIGFKGKAYVIGADAMKEEIRAKGVDVFDNSAHTGQFPLPYDMARVELDESIRAVVMGFDHEVNYYKISYAGMLLNTDPSRLFLVTNKDRHFPANGRRLPGAGTFVSALEIVADRPPYIVGKPGPFIIEDICSRFSMPRESLCMVGDNLFTDIEFGRTANIATLMVETGVNSKQQAESPENASRAPDFIVPSIASFLPGGDLSRGG
ncbi:unnamed protein product [Vitrella brassicaformis CCMP3155]|uniref:4-nitrophenylphosphatase n=1 Tax=Vitrella brassicaformis (strain CCMP3155) TaxID=1169540 RepID=A0A0G4FHP3_VITBC|nr:unnamed protein product [Vitrella brassicaformis CCMP3155]|eukprot:CEM12833.1 unnamed protein product [Vitrella brassicaformis CCMP3155]